MPDPAILLTEEDAKAYWHNRRPLLLHFQSSNRQEGIMVSPNLVSLLVHAARDNGIDLEPYGDEYTGRGHNKPTHAVKCDSIQDFIAAVAAVGVEFQVASVMGDDFVEQCRRFSIDNLGRGLIIY